jgi:hypothetical protein
VGGFEIGGARCRGSVGICGEKCASVCVVEWESVSVIVVVLRETFWRRWGDSAGARGHVILSICEL